MKPSARSHRIEKLSTSSREMKPRPGTPSLPSTKGPTIIPAIRYAVTAGRWTSFARRERRSPASRAIDRLKRIVSTDKKSPSFKI